MSARWSVKLVICMLLLAAIAACAKRVHWSEDVQLSDGRVVTLKGYQKFGGPHEIGQIPMETNSWLEFKHPDTGEAIRWEATREYRPIALLLDSQTAQLLVVLEFDGRYKRNCPSPSYLLFQYREHRWTEKPIESLRGLKVRRNMLSTPTEAKQLMEKNGLHLSAQETLQSATGYTEGRRIDFGKLTEQTYGMKGCNPPFNWLLEDEEIHE